MERSHANGMMIDLCSRKPGAAQLSDCMVTTVCKCFVTDLKVNFADADDTGEYWILMPNDPIQNIFYICKHMIRQG
jgi:hypothetical protein